MRLLISFLFAMLFAKNAQSQANLRFCGFVREDGSCVFNNHKFFSSPDSLRTAVIMRANNPQGMGAQKLFFNVNKLDTAGKETPYSKQEQAVEKDWMYVWKTINAESPGRYSVRVTNERDELQCQGTFELFLP